MVVERTAAAGVHFKVLASGLKIGVDAGVEVGDGSGGHLDGSSWDHSKSHGANV